MLQLHKMPLKDYLCFYPVTPILIIQPIHHLALLKNAVQLWSYSNSYVLQNANCYFLSQVILFLISLFFLNHEFLLHQHLWVLPTGGSKSHSLQQDTNNYIKGDSNSSQFEIARQFVKHGVSEWIKAVTKFTSAWVPELSMVYNNTNTLLKLFWWSYLFWCGTPASSGAPALYKSKTIAMKPKQRNCNYGGKMYKRKSDKGHNTSSR
jgi:hypothetical protein